MVIMGHAIEVETKMLASMKNSHKNLKIAQWFLDPLTRKGPDYNKINQGFLIN